MKEQARKGFRSSARGWDFMEFKLKNPGYLVIILRTWLIHQITTGFQDSLRTSIRVLMWKCSCLIFDQNPSQKQNFQRIMQEIKCHHNSSKNSYHAIR